MPGLQDVAERLSTAFDTRVTVSLGKRKGKIVVEFGSVDDLQRIVDLMNACERLTYDTGNYVTVTQLLVARPAWPGSKEETVCAVNGNWLDAAPFDAAARRQNGAVAACSPILEGPAHTAPLTEDPGRIVSARITPLRLEAFEQLPKHARRCVFWEVDPSTPRGDGSPRRPRIREGSVAVDGHAGVGIVRTGRWRMRGRGDG